MDPPQVPGGGATLNPFIVVDDAAGFIDFATQVFEASENARARTVLPDGRLIHAEIELGGSKLLLSERLDGWPAHPGYLQLWVDDAPAVLDRATALDAVVVTEAVPFYGETTLARMSDPWGNLWWLYAPAPWQEDPRPSWDGGSDVVFRTINDEMQARGRPPLT